MFRKLTKEEYALTIKGIHKQKKEIMELKETEDIYKLRKEYLKVKHEYEAAALPYNAKMEDEEVDKTLKAIQDKIIGSQKSIEQMEKHITEGVEIRENNQSG